MRPLPWHRHASLCSYVHSSHVSCLHNSKGKKAVHWHDSPARAGSSSQALLSGPSHPGGGKKLDLDQQDK